MPRRSTRGRRKPSKRTDVGAKVVRKVGELADHYVLPTPDSGLWQPISVPSSEAADRSDIAAPSYGTAHSSKPVTAEGGMYPHTCTLLLGGEGEGGECPGEVAMMWPLAAGPDQEYRDVPHTFTPRFDACCVRDLGAVLPTAKATSTVQLFDTLLLDGRALSVEVGRAADRCVAMWDHAAQGRLMLLPADEYKAVERRLAHVLHMAQIVQADLNRIADAQSYEDAVVTGAAAGIPGAMPRLPGLPRHAGALDYMRAEFYHQVRLFLQAFGRAVHNKDPFDTGNDSWFEYVPRLMSSAATEAWRAVRRQTIISTMLLAVGTVVAIRGAQMGSLFEVLSQTNVHSLLLTLSVEFLIEAAYKGFGDVGEVTGTVREVLDAAGKAAQMLASYETELLSNVFAGLGVVGTMFGVPLGSVYAKFISTYMGVNEKQLQWMMTNSVRAFAAAVGVGAKLYPAAAKWGPVALLFHNLLWLAVPMAAASHGFNAAKHSWLGGLTSWLLDLDEEASIAGMLRDALHGFVKDGVAHRGVVDLTMGDVDAFLEGHGLDLVLLIVGALAATEWLTGSMDEDELLAEAIEWSARRPDAFFRRARGFLPEVNGTLFRERCRGGEKDCEERLRKLRIDREAMLRRCEHPDEAYRRKGYRVCDDY